MKQKYATIGDAIVAMLGWPSFKGGRHSGTYDYGDGFAVMRFDFDDGSKQFRPVCKTDGAWVLGDPPGLLPLYCLTELRATGPTETAIVVEGEKCADLAADLGFVATTSAHGSKSANKTDWAPLAGRAVVVLPDNDKTGEGYAKTVCAILTALSTPATVRILRLPDLPDGGDVVDWAAALRPEADASDLLAELIATRAEPFTPIAPAVAARPDGPGDEMHLTELGLAERLVEWHGADLRYCSAIGWLAWQNAHWKPDDTNEAERRVVQTVKRLHDVANGLADRREAVDLSKFAYRCESSGRIRGALDLARVLPGIAITVDQLDRDPWTLNCQNGMIDLRSGKLRPHCREDLCTKVTAANYDPDAASDGTFLRFLADVFPDEEMRAFAQRAIGASLCGLVRDHVLHIWFGPTSGNGKSTLAGAVCDAFGSYAMVAAPKLLIQTRHEAHPTQFADLHGKRFVALSESGENARLDEELAKRLTGGDRITARRMRMDFFEFDPSHTIFAFTNHKPIIRDSSPAIWRRVQLWPFNETFAVPDLDMPEKLRADRDALLVWAVAGCRKWLADGLSPPAGVTAATSDYRRESDVLGQFFGEFCRIDPMAVVAACDLYASYRGWADSAGEKAMTRDAFGRLLTARGHEKRAHGPTRRIHYFGIGLRAMDHETCTTNATGERV